MSFSSFSYLIAIVALIALIVRVYYWLKGNIVAKEKLKTSEAEVETIKQNIKATTVKEHELATASDDERIRLRKKWSKSKP